MMRPDVSVVIPTHNRSRQLSRAVRSALAQRGVRLEVLVVDDGSTDDTAEVVSTMGDDRVRYLRRTVAAGTGAARNDGVAEALGRWIAFLDDDDVWAPNKLSRQVNAVSGSGRFWAYGGDVSVDDNLNVLAGEPPPTPDEVVGNLGRYNSVPAGASNVIVERDTLVVAGPWDPALRNVTDWDMWIRIASVGPPDWVCSPLVAISQHEDNMTRDMPTLLHEVDVVARRYDLPVDRAKHYRWAAWYAALEGRRTDAARYYARAVGAGDVTSLGRIAVAVADPGFATRRARRRPAGPDPWIAEAREWLDALKDAASRP